MSTTRLATEHPSYLALDRASLGETSAELRAHLDGCNECRSYLESLIGPAPASGIIVIQRALERQRQARRRAWWSALSIAAAACGLVAFLELRQVAVDPDQPRPSALQPYVGDKGFLSVWIYVRHGSNTQLWDGKKAVFAGDRLRLKVDPARFRRVEVYSVKDPDAPALLYAGGVAPGQSATLPDAWEVDAEPGSERLVVVFSNEPVKPVWSDWLRGKVQSGISVLQFILPKSTSPDPNPGSTSP
jgi:hypothetical protein